MPSASAQRRFRMIVSRPRRVTAVIVLICLTALGLSHSVSDNEAPLFHENLSNQSTSLEQLIKLHSGVYSDKSWVHKARGEGSISPASLSRTVLLLTSNWGFLDFSINFLCTAAEIAPYDPIFIAQNPLAHEFFQSLGITSVDGQAFEVKEAAMSSVDWGASAYLSIVRAKLFFVLGVLRLGNNVLLSDVDIVFNDDPVPDIVEGIDFQYQPNWKTAEDGFRDKDGGEGNTGFYFMKSNNRTISFLENVITSLPTTGADDQTAAFDILRQMKLDKQATYLLKPIKDIHAVSAASPSMMLTTAFDGRDYACGIEWIRNVKQYESSWIATGAPLPARPKIAHANWITGHMYKQQAFREHGFWKVDDAMVEDYKQSFIDNTTFPRNAISEGWRRFCVR